MARSTLPPIVWEATCGHRNEVRSEHGGYPTKCKTCGASVWVPKRGAARAPSARSAAGLFGSRRSPAARTKPSRPALPTPRPDPLAEYAAELDDEEKQGILEQSARFGELAARVLGDLGAGLANGALTGVPIPPSRPAAPQSAKPKPVLTIRAEPVLLRRREPEPGFGQHLVPETRPPCELCSFMGWRNHEGLFARAIVALEMLRDGRIVVCGNCAARIRKRFPGEVVKARKLPGQPGPPRNGTVYRAVLYPQPDPVPRAAIPRGQSNQTIEMSGRGRERQLTLAEARQAPGSRRAAARSARCSCSAQSGPGHRFGCVFAGLAAPLTAWS